MKSIHTYRVTKPPIQIQGFEDNGNPIDAYCRTGACPGRRTNIVSVSFAPREHSQATARVEKSYREAI